MSSQPATRNSVIDVAMKYLDALVSHDASSVPIAPDAWRTEEGRNSGLGADDIRVKTESPIMHGITAIRDLRWFVDGHDAVAFYLLDSGGRTAHIAERFRIIDGLIHEIEAIFYVSPVAMQSRWPLDPNEVWTEDNTPPAT
jgi:hypothetical protein